MKTLLPDSTKYDLACQLQACQSRSRRNGKVARLPFALRMQINYMLEDGLPYKVIIEKLGPAGSHLNEDNLSNWRLGGFQDYLGAQAMSDRARAQTEAAAEFVRDNGHLDPGQIERAYNEVAVLQCMETMMEHGEELAQNAFKKNPSKWITMINACCHMSNASRALQKRKPRRLQAPPSNIP